MYKSQLQEKSVEVWKKLLKEIQAHLRESRESSEKQRLRQSERDVKSLIASKALLPRENRSFKPATQN